jgi:hypothetical protein
MAQQELGLLRSYLRHMGGQAHSTAVTEGAAVG